MAVWEITAPDGTVYEVEGEDKKGAIAALHAKIQQDVQDEYGHLPWYKKAGTAVNDIARIGSNFVTSGNRDRFAEYLGGRAPKEEQWETEKARMRAGSAGLGAELIPMLASAPLFARQGAGMATNALIGAGEGGAFGGLQAGGRNESVPEGMLTGAVTGGMVNTGGQAVKAAVKSLPRVTAKSGVALAKELGKLNIKEGLLAAGSGLTANALGAPIDTAMSVLAGVGIPAVGAMGRAVAKPAVRKAVADAARTAAKNAKENPQKYWDPATRQFLIGTGTGGVTETRRKR